MVDGTDLFEYFLCPYKVYNRHNRDKSLMLPPSDFAKRLWEIGREHEKEITSVLKVVKPEYPIGDFAKGFLQTFKLMQIGSEVISQGVLKEGTHRGIPDLLFKQKGESKLGSFFYIPADIKSSLKSKEEQLMQLMFYDMLLEKVQGFSANIGIMILKGTSELIDLSKYKEKFNESLRMVEKLNKGLEYGLHIDSVCRECPWRGVCIPLAEKTKDVSLIYGLSRPLHYKMLDYGIKTLEDLKETDTEKLIQICSVTEPTVEKWKEQANVVLTNKGKVNKIELPETENHICLDIETAEDGSLYLIGLWQNNKFKYFFSEKDEKKIVDEFVEYVLALKDFRLYHYGVFERTAFKALFNKYSVPEHIQKEIFNKMIDTFYLVKGNAILPLRSYGLKEVAKCFGFKWRSSDASGGNSMLWFKEWKDKKNPELLKKILEYNEDDVKATQIVLDKLSK